MSRRRGRRDAHSAEHHVDERWMASYMDMITVLMCLFLVLFAMSSIDANKYKLLSNSLATGFGATKSKTVDTAEGVVVPKKDEGKKGTTTKNSEVKLSQAAQKELAADQALQKQVTQALAAQGLTATVTTQITDRGLTVHLVADTAFGGNSAQLTTAATRTLDAVAAAVGPLPEQISVEGNANPGGNPAPYSSMWALSSARAISVVQYLQGQGIAPTRLGAVGYGDSRPLTTDRSAAGQASNRRVDIVLLSTASQAVRDAVAKAAADGT